MFRQKSLNTENKEQRPAEPPIIVNVSPPQKAHKESRVDLCDTPAASFDTGLGRPRGVQKIIQRILGLYGVYPGSAKCRECRQRALREIWRLGAVHGEAH
jgi:hypothetical protein